MIFLDHLFSDPLVAFKYNGWCFWEEFTDINCCWSIRNCRSHWLSASASFLELSFICFEILCVQGIYFNKTLVCVSHHVVHYEGQGSPVQPNSKPKSEVLALCGKAAESLRLDLQHLLSHLKPDTNSSIYAATHPKLVQDPPCPLGLSILHEPIMRWLYPLNWTSSISCGFFIQQILTCYKYLYIINMNRLIYIFSYIYIYITHSKIICQKEKSKHKINENHSSFRKDSHLIPVFEHVNFVHATTGIGIIPRVRHVAFTSLFSFLSPFFFSLRKNL